MSSNESRKNRITNSMTSTIILLCLLIRGCHQDENYPKQDTNQQTKHVFENDYQNERMAARHLYKYEELELFRNCKGILDLRAYVKVDRICEDCYNLYREPQIYQECRHKCYQNDYFPACVEVLQLTEYVEEYKNAIKILNGASPDF